MNRLDERARQAAASARRLADTVDPEEALTRIEGRPGRQRWVVPAVVLGCVAALVVGALALTGALTDDALRIDNDPGIVDQPEGAWPPAGYASEDGWINVDPAEHGIEGLPSDVVVFDGDFLLLDTGGRVWRSSDGLAWEDRTRLNLSNGDLVVDRGRVVAMGVVDDGRQLRVLWSENGDDWTAVDARANPALAVVPDEEQWFEPRLITGPRGFLIAGNVWLEQPEPSGSATGPANAGAKIRVLESADGAEWRTTQEWDNTGTANLIGATGDTNGYTLVFQGDGLVDGVQKGRTRTFVSGDEGWTEAADHPGWRPVRIARERGVPYVGDGPGGDDLPLDAQRFHTWEFSLGEPNSGEAVWFRTAGGWEQASFDGPPTDQPGWWVNTIWDAGDALYALVIGVGDAGTTLYRSVDGYLWEALPRDPVFTDATLTGSDAVATTAGRRSVVAVACCQPGVFDERTHTELWVRRAPAGTSEDPGPAGPGTAPTTWERVRDADLDTEPSPMLLAVETLDDRLVAFREHLLLGRGDGGSVVAGTTIWISRDGTAWEQAGSAPTAGVGRDLVATTVADGLVYALVHDGDTPTLWSSRDGESWERLPDVPADAVVGSARDFRATGLAVGPDGPVIVGERVFGSDGASFTDTQPIAVLSTEDGWAVETLGPQGRNVFVHDVAIVGDEPVAVGGIEPTAGSATQGRVWMREGPGAWTAVPVEGAPVLDLVTATETGWLATPSGSGEPLTVVRGLAGDRATTVIETVEVEGVMLFDLVTVDGLALGTGNTNAGGPTNVAAVVRFGLDAGAKVTRISESGGAARAVTRAGSALYVVGEATDPADDGEGFVSRSAVWRGPIPGLVPGSRRGSSPAPADCGAGDLSGEPEPQPGLPDDVQTMRVEIASALVRCDHGLLAELALDGSSEFTASFGGVDDLSAWFADQDLRLFRLLLDLSFASATDGEGVTYYAWPSAFLESTDEAWQELYEAGLATPEDRAEMEEAFGGWVGFRHGITADGDWIFTVAGD